MNELLQQFVDTLTEKVKDEINGLKLHLGWPLQADALEFVAASAADLQRWGTLYLAGELMLDEVGALVKGRGELAAMKALTAAGLTAVEVDKFRQTMLDTVAGLVGATLKSLK